MMTCIDCTAEGVTTVRPTPHGGPRSPLCVTHHRARRKRTSARRHELRLESDFGITAEQYWALYEAQGGVCYICQIATGRTKRLTVDHDHSCTEEHPPEKGCPKCIRGLVCSFDNELIGRRGPDALRRAAGYLEDPPARYILLP